MTFNSFYEVYRNDLQNRIQQNTWVTKSSIIEKKILPYFGDKRVRDVKPVDVLHWQNVIMETTDENGMPYSPVYLKTIHNQLSAMFNHAVRFYGLPENPAAKAGNMGKEKCGEVLVWTKDEYLQFIETLKGKPASFYAFETLYWCGLRLGEMLALTPADFDFERKIIHVTKSFQRIKGEDIITPPKTEKKRCATGGKPAKRGPTYGKETLRQTSVFANGVHRRRHSADHCTDPHLQSL